MHHAASCTQAVGKERQKRQRGKEARSSSYVESLVQDLSASRLSKAIYEYIPTNS